MKITPIAGYTKYSNVKLVLLAWEKSLTGYSISPSSTTIRPNNQVINCLKRKISWASRILLRGTNESSMMIVMIQADARTITSLLKTIIPYVDRYFLPELISAKSSISMTLSSSSLGNHLINKDRNFYAHRKCNPFLGRFLNYD